jgi:hypothetical protein
MLRSQADDTAWEGTIVLHFTEPEARLMLDAEPKTGVQLRKSKRLPVTFPLTYRLDGDPSVKLGGARDIGSGGIYFESIESLPKEALVTVWFELRPELKIEVRGRVVASTSIDGPQQMHRNRVAFAAVSDGVRDSILSFVDKAWRADLMHQAELHTEYTLKHISRAEKT